MNAASMIVWLFAALACAFYAGHLRASDFRKCWHRALDDWDRDRDSWKRKAASFHRRSQQYESQCCRLRRDLCGETIRANWWKSEAKRLGWKPANEERGQ